MATTIVPAYDGPIEPFEVEELRATIRERLAESQGDEDKACDIEDNVYYEGRVSAFTEIIEWLLNPELRS